MENRKIVKGASWLALFILMIVYAFGCGIKDKIEKQNRAKEKADFIMQNLSKEE